MHAFFRITSAASALAFAGLIGAFIGVAIGEGDAEQRVNKKRDAEVAHVNSQMRDAGFCEYPLVMQRQYGCNYTIVAKNKEDRR